MSQPEQRPLIKAAYVKTSDSPADLTGGTKADLYYLGEAWIEELTNILSYKEGSLSDTAFRLRVLEKEVRWLIETVPLNESVRSEIVSRMKDGKARPHRDIFPAPYRLQNLVNSVVNKLVAEGRLVKTKNGRYRLKEDV